MFGGLPEHRWQDTLETLIQNYRTRSETAQQLADDPVDDLRARFIRMYPGGADAATDLLELGRASYRLRDDDNIHLGKIRSLVVDAEMEWTRRHGKEVRWADANASAPDSSVRAVSVQPSDSGPGEPISRQIVGQPASQGIGDGLARVIFSFSDLEEFRNGEILVCDSIDPTMTWVCPLAAGIVERRGGMLIHGAIIAREYGVPCVTGVTGATERIRTGDRVTVDGFLGIVVIRRELPDGRIQG